MRTFLVVLGVLALIALCCGGLALAVYGGVDLLVGDSPVTYVPPAENPAPAEPAAVNCRDGELVLVHAADAGDSLSRLPVGEADRVDVLEISWPGQGFGGLDRAIVVIPRLGDVWQVNTLPGAQTVATRGYCGTNAEVAEWAITTHVPSLRQASRDHNGNQPDVNEIPVFILNFEARTIIVVKAASEGPTATEVLRWIEVSFNNNGNINAVPMHVP